MSVSYEMMSALTRHSQGDLKTASRPATLHPLRARQSIRFAAIFPYLRAIVLALIFIHGRGTLELPQFVHQGF